MRYNFIDPRWGNYVNMDSNNSRNKGQMDCKKEYKKKTICTVFMHIIYKKCEQQYEEH